MVHNVLYMQAHVTGGCSYKAAKTHAKARRLIWNNFRTGSVIQISSIRNGASGRVLLIGRKIAAWKGGSCFKANKTREGSATIEFWACKTCGKDYEKYKKKIFIHHLIHRMLHMLCCQAPQSSPLLFTYTAGIVPLYSPYTVPCEIAKNVSLDCTFSFFQYTLVSSVIRMTLLSILKIDFKTRAILKPDFSFLSKKKKKHNKCHLVFPLADERA